MKILYRQEQGEPVQAGVVYNSCLKQIDFAYDLKVTSRKVHYHTSFELHVIEAGSQTYRFGEIEHRIEAGCFLLIPPGVRHCVTGIAPATAKFSVTFDAEPNSPFGQIQAAFFGETDRRIRENIAWIQEERKRRSVFFPTLARGRLLECLVLLLRLRGLECTQAAETGDEDARLSMAKQYIEDNIASNVKVSEAAEYCHLSTKQLTRLFQQHEGVTPAAYIQKRRARRLELLLGDRTLSLSRISEIMSFSSECYLNAFFKKHVGMSPGTYRKMIQS